MQKAFPQRCRNIVVIGGSAGARPALREILSRLDPGLEAAIFVVQHVARVRDRLDFSAGLASDSTLPLHPARDSAPLQPGEVRMAPADHHLLIGTDRMLLSRGPRENHARPAIDALFRSAAARQQGRVVAVLLSGYLSDGVSGLDAVRRCGGLTVVQDPRDAEVPDMPQSALDHHDPDFTVPASQIAGLIAQLARQPAPEDTVVPRDIEMEVDMADGAGLSIDAEEEIGALSPFACPDCGGNLRQLEDVVARYRCHVGHGYTADALAEAQAQRLDEALWTALRGLRERARMLRKLARDGKGAASLHSDSYLASAGELETQAEVLTRFILSRSEDPDAERIHGAEHSSG